MAPTPSAAAGAVAEKHLQDIYEQELKDYKQERIYKVALNQGNSLLSPKKEGCVWTKLL